jgi:pimeloyl-ACP methyl ester carboxylesterase
MGEWNLRSVIGLAVAVAAITLQGCGGGGGGTEPAAGNTNPTGNSVPTTNLVSSTQIASVTKAQAAALFALAKVPLIPAYDVKVYKVVYKTSDASGATINASGALVVPQSLAAPAPLLSSQHGTTTLKSAVPSTAPPASLPEALVFGTAGYVTVMPDYIGYGESGDRFHPYLHAKSLAGAVVDLLRAAKTFCATNNIALNGKLFLEGYSEGGYATMAATREIQEKHAAEFAITASAPMAGPYDLSTSLLEIMSSSSYPSPGFVAFAFWAYDRVYALNMLGQVFMPVYGAKLDSLFDGTHDLSTGINPALSTDLATLFQGQFLTDFRGSGTTALKARIQENNLYNWTPAVAIRLIHCKGDDIVAFKNSQTAFASFSSNGAKRFVQLVDPLPPGKHSSCAQPALLAAKGWFDTLR